ncbi:MAG: DUF3276 family protein [Ginsengibacter sp.]
MAYENNDNKRMESVYSQRIRAGKRRTYFFDVRETRGNDYYLTITESRKKFNEDGYDRHKIFLYKEDFNKFLKGMTEAIDYVKTDLMPDFDFDAFSHENSDIYEGNQPYIAKDNEDSESAPSENEEAATPEISADTPKEEIPEATEAPEAPVTNQMDEKAERLEPEEPKKDSNDTPPASNLFDEEVDKW